MKKRKNFTTEITEEKFYFFAVATQAK